MGGYVLAVSSEHPRYARWAASEWKLTFPVIGDPKNVLADHLIDQGIIPDLCIVDRFDRERTMRNQAPGNVGDATWRWVTRHPFMKHYRHGCVQPAVAIVRSNRSVAFGMAVNKLSRRNGFGAADRPKVHVVWAAFKALLHSKAGAGADADGELGGTGGAGGNAVIDGSHFTKDGIFDEAYLQCAAFAVVAVLAIAALLASGRDPGGRISAALAAIALAFAAARWPQFLRSLVLSSRGPSQEREKEEEEEGKDADEPRPYTADEWIEALRRCCGAAVSGGDVSGESAFAKCSGNPDARSSVG